MVRGLAQRTQLRRNCRCSLLLLTHLKICMEIMIFFFVWLLTSISRTLSHSIEHRRAACRRGFVAALRLSAAAVPGPLATRPY